MTRGVAPEPVDLRPRGGSERRDDERVGAERLRLLLDATGAGMWDARLDGGETFLSPHVGPILGYAAGDGPRTLRRALHHVVPEHRARALQRLRESHRAGGPFVLDCRVRDAAGHLRWLHVRGAVVRDPLGGPARSVGTLLDITNEAVSRETRFAHERELARAQGVARIGSWTWDFRTQRLSWSAELYAIVGLDPARVAPSEAALDALIDEADRARLRAAHERCITHDEPVDARFSICRPDGEVRIVHALAEAVRDADGAPAALIGTLQDVTDDVRRAETQARLEAQLHHAQKLESLGLLAGGIAHDFNNLLVGVLSNASLALLDLDERAPARRVVLDIERTAQRAADLTRQLLAYSGKGRFIVEPLDLSALAREMSQLLRTVVSKDATLTLELDEALPAIHGDATQLRQVIMNLLTNASDALQGRAGTISVRTTRGDRVATPPEALHFGDIDARTERVCLEVRDSGTGMTRQTAERIFDPFFTTKFTGRGLGLAATLGIVRGHQGGILVDTAPGAGTCIQLHFPVAERRRTPRTTPAVEPRRPAHGLALVVDDDDVVRSVTSALLEREGYAVESVAGGREALDRLAADGPAVRFVLLDLTMPGLSGIDVLQALRAREQAEGRPPVAVFLMSGYAEQDVTRGLGDLPITGFLQKPFTLTDLDTLLARLPDA